VLAVNNERFMVPEALFRPSDIGMEEAGLAEAVVQAVQAAHPHLHALLYSNILLTGGTARCPGFRQRLLAELRPLVPDDYEVGGAHACVRGCASEERRHAGSKVPASQPWPRLVPASPPLPPPHSSQLGVYLADDPVLCAWKGAALLAASPEYGQLAVTQQEWRQRGMAACSRWDA
jgi:actin-related protein 6